MPSTWTSYPMSERHGRSGSVTRHVSIDTCDGRDALTVTQRDECDGKRDATVTPTVTVNVSELATIDDFSCLPGSPPASETSQAGLRSASFLFGEARLQAKLFRFDPRAEVGPAWLEPRRDPLVIRRRASRFLVHRLAYVSDEYVELTVSPVSVLIVLRQLDHCGNEVGGFHGVQSQQHHLHVCHDEPPPVTSSHVDEMDTPCPTWTLQARGAGGRAAEEDRRSMNNEIKIWAAAPPTPLRGGRRSRERSGPKTATRVAYLRCASR